MKFFLFVRWPKVFSSVLFLLVIGLFLVQDASAHSDDEKRDLDANGLPVSAAPVDRQIAEAIGHISSSEIEHTIATLVAFRNRSTISSMEKDLPADTGVTAADRKSVV